MPAGLFDLLPGVDASWSVFLGAWAGLLARISLDWRNTFRIALLASFGKQHYSADAVFFIDAVTLALVAVFYLLYLGFDLGAGLWLYPMWFIAHLASKYWLRVRVGRLLKPLFAIPGSLYPLLSVAGPHRFAEQGLLHDRTAITALSEEPCH